MTFPGYVMATITSRNIISPLMALIENDNATLEVHEAEDLSLRVTQYKENSSTTKTKALRCLAKSGRVGFSDTASYPGRLKTSLKPSYYIPFQSDIVWGFGSMCTCIYCALYCLCCVFVLFRLCTFIVICSVCTGVRTAATE